MKLLSTQTHGAIDYAWAVALPALPRLLGWGPAGTRLLTGAGAGTLLYSLVTRYEWGLAPVLSMPAHLAFDLAQGATLLTAPLWLDEEGEVSATLVGLGLIALAVAATTDRTPPQEAVHGPSDGARQEHPHLRTAPASAQTAPLGRLG